MLKSINLGGPAHDYLDADNKLNAYLCNEIKKKQNQDHL